MQSPLLTEVENKFMGMDKKYVALACLFECAEWWGINEMDRKSGHIIEDCSDEHRFWEQNPRESQN